MKLKKNHKDFTPTQWEWIKEKIENAYNQGWEDNAKRIAKEMKKYD